jgi:hypothetical protein
MRPTGIASRLALALSLPCACGSGRTDESRQALEVLDPKTRQHGLTDAEWAIEWSKYTNGYTNKWAAPACIAPILDTTGAHCGDYQDPSSPVFFLVGAYGRVVRDECVVPRDKTLFFPLLSIVGDNTPDRKLTEQEIVDYVNVMFDAMIVDSLHLSVDGKEAQGLERGAVPSAPYTFTVPPPPNRYSCDVTPDPKAEGQFFGYVGGYWSMLPPLSSGTHRIEFGGSTEPTKYDRAFVIDAVYNLRVE